MNAAKPPVWDMIETLTRSRLVVPPLGSTDPGQVHAFGQWHWGTRDLNALDELYLFDVEAVARNIIDHGPLFSLSYAGHGINSYALSLVTTVPAGDVAFFTQGGLGGGYSDEDKDIARINDAYQRIARESAELDGGTRTDRVRWLVFSSFMRDETGIVDLDGLREGAGVDSALEWIDDSVLFDELKARRAAADPPAPPVAGIVPHLAEVLRRLKDDSHLVINVLGSVRYVQFATFRPNLRLETIGIRYLERDNDAMTVDHLVWLAYQGWHDADDGGNLWREWIPADEDEAAAAAVEVLVKVHGVTDIDQIWFHSEDDDALAALDHFSPPRPVPPGGLQPTNRFRAAVINAALGGEPLRLLSGSKVVAVVDYIARGAVLEMLALVDGEVLRRHDGRWRDDPDWGKVLPKAPARSIVPLTQEQFDKVRVQIDRSSAGKPWKPFKASDLERYWPSYCPNDPDLFDWSQLDSLDELHER